MVAQLSTAEILDIRDVVGDTESAPEISDETRIQAWYQQAGGDLPTTYVYYLYRLWGRLRTTVSHTTDHGDREALIEKVRTTKEQLDFWLGMTGLDAGTIQQGELPLGIDTPCPDWYPDCRD